MQHRTFQYVLQLFKVDVLVLVLGKIKPFAQITIFCALISTAPAHADSLMDTYSQALRNDPTFKAATATWFGARQNLPIARAGALPTFSTTANFARQYDETVPFQFSETAPNGYNWSSGYMFSLSQPIFNVAAWRAIEGAQASVKAAAATYAYATQDLMQRVATAYFLVMSSYERLRFTIANKQAVWQQLEQARQQFNVGLIAITGVYDAQSSYDRAVAAEIGDRNTLDKSLESLRAITGHYYTKLDSIKTVVPLLAPTPNDLDQWTQAATMQNYNIQAQHFSVIQARANIKVTAAGYYPVVNAVGSYTTSYMSPDAATGNVTTDTFSAGFSLSYTPFQGGLITAQTRQLIYTYLNSSALMDFTYHDVISKTRQSFLSVTSGISQVLADKQAVISAKNAFEATKAGYDIGTRTMVDVLNSLTAVYRAEQTYYNDQYTYLQNIVQLKINAGTLSPNDILQISRWMTKTVELPVVQKSYVPIKFIQAKLNPEPQDIGAPLSPSILAPMRKDGMPPLPPLPDARPTPFPQMPNVKEPETPLGTKPSTKPKPYVPEYNPDLKNSKTPDLPKDNPDLKDSKKPESTKIPDSSLLKIPSPQSTVDATPALAIPAPQRTTDADSAMQSVSFDHNVGAHVADELPDPADSLPIP